MFCHVDADAFFASVLVRKHPELRGKPLLALGMGGGCVISASYEAKACGVKTGMRVSEARKLCPQALAMPSDFAETGKASDAIETVLQSRCAFLEQMSIDEWYLDLRACVGGVPGHLEAWAKDIREYVLARTAISVSIGVGPTKLLAKMAGEYRKPAGVTVLDVPGLSREQFLADRPAAAIPGVGRKRVRVTDAHHWNTALDIARAPEALLKSLFGKQGPELQKELNGEPVYPLITSPAPPKSVSRARSFIPLKDKDLLWAHSLRHMEYLVLKMRRHGLACGGLSLWLRNKEYTGFTSASRSWENPRDTEAAIQEELKQCFEEIYEHGTAYTQVGAALWRLSPKGAEQSSLFTTPEELESVQSLQKSLDALHEKFGRNAITRGSAIAIKSGTVQKLDLSVYE